MKIVTLTENASVSEAIMAEHGLSLYIETGEKKILFDMGQTDAFIQNAQKIGIDLSQVDFAVLSHGHYDHGGGLYAFLKVNQKAPVYLHKAAFGEYYNGTQKYIGLDASVKGGDRLVFTEGSVQLLPGIRLMDCNDQNWQYDAWGLNCKEQAQFFPDPFLHEQYLEITEGQKRILISGCSHKGILNIAQYFQPNILLGGFHLNKQEKPEILKATAQALLATGTQYYTGHCTGSKQLAIMKQIMGEKLLSISAGTVVEI